MVPHRVAPRVAKLFLVVIPLSVLPACTERGQLSSAKKPAEITLPKGALTPQVLETIERDLAKYDWGPAHDACDKCPAASDVTIRYVGKTKDIKGDDGPANRRIVALIQNYSTQDVLHEPTNWTFRPRTKYLMWVHSKNRKATWGFIELGDKYDANPQEIGRLEHCRNGDSPTDDANFKGCKDAHDSNASSGLVRRAYAASEGASSTAPASASISRPGWVGCDPDCCTGTTNPVIMQAQPTSP